ncbi:hypothetical protein KA344_22255 [bacterium]|nr:hypothetical protein [bacterium]
MELLNTESAKSLDPVKESSSTENSALSFAPNAQTQRHSLQEMARLAGRSNSYLPKIQLDSPDEASSIHGNDTTSGGSGDTRSDTRGDTRSNTSSSDKPQTLIVKEAVNAYKEKGPTATLQLLREDLAAFEKDSKLTLKLPTGQGGAGFDEATTNKLTQERSAERWHAVKQALLEQDPNAIEKLKVAYLDHTLKAMSAAGNRYGSLEPYGVSGQSHFENQKSNGSSAMIREFASQISKEYSAIANPNGSDLDGSRIDKRELDQYKTKQAQSWR